MHIWPLLKRVNRIPRLSSVMLTPGIRLTSSNQSNEKPPSSIKPYPSNSSLRVDSPIDTFSLNPPSTAEDTSVASQPSTSYMHTLFVCTKCTRTEPDSRVCTSSATCRLSNTSTNHISDMEDLGLPSRPKTGVMLYKRLLERHNKAGSPTYAFRDRLHIVGTECLSKCDQSNVIAFTAPKKYTYQFGDIRHEDAEQMRDVLEFTRSWMESKDGFSKTMTRPKGLKRNVLARIPPLPI